jgi:hypothetical protein
MADITEQQFLEQDPEVLGLQRQRQLANLLTGQAFNQPQGQMISGHYVRPSALQQALPMINAAIGGLTNANLDTKQQELAAALRGKQMEVAQQYAQAKTPQEKLAAAMSPYAPKMIQGAAAELFKPQKLGEGETIQQMDFGTGQFVPMAQGGQKIAPEVRQAMQMLGINKPFDQLTPQDLKAINGTIYGLKQAGATVVNTGQHGFENTLKLGENFKNEPIYKTHQEINQAYKQINAGLDKNNAAGDYSAAVKISKLLDPTSVVRESEVATVANATGALDKLYNYADKISKGVILNPEQRKQYRQLAKDFYKISGEQYNETRNKYLQLGEQNQLSGVPTILGQPWKAPVEVAPPKVPSANQQLGIPAVNLFNQADAIIGNTGK